MDDSWLPFDDPPIRLFNGRLLNGVVRGCSGYDLYFYTDGIRAQGAVHYDAPTVAGPDALIKSGLHTTEPEWAIENISTVLLCAPGLVRPGRITIVSSDRTRFTGFFVSPKTSPKRWEHIYRVARMTVPSAHALTRRDQRAVDRAQRRRRQYQMSLR